MTLLRGSFQTRLDAAGDGPKWNLLFPRGEWHGANLAPIGGSITIDDAMLKEMVANWEAAGRPPLPIRKTHQHLDPGAAPLERLELEAAYGLLTDLRVTAAGLEVLADWNEAGRAEVRAGKWNFWSPEWTPTHTDRRTGEQRGWWVQGTALTNDPFFNTMPRVAASATQPPTHQPTLKGHTMPPELMKRLKAALKCAESATDEEVCAAAEMFGKPTEVEIELEKKLEASLTAAVSPLQASLKAAEEKVAALQAEATAAKAALQERDVEALMAAAKAEGKAVEPLREFIVASAKRDGIDSAKRLVAAVPSTVPMKEMGSAGKEATPEATIAAASKEYHDGLDAFAKEKGLTIAAAAHLFNRANPELAKRAFTTTR